MGGGPAPAQVGRPTPNSDAGVSTVLTANLAVCLTAAGAAVARRWLAAGRRGQALALFALGIGTAVAIRPTAVLLSTPIGFAFATHLARRRAWRAAATGVGLRRDAIVRANLGHAACTREQTGGAVRRASAGPRRASERMGANVLRVALSLLGPTPINPCNHALEAAGHALAEPLGRDLQLAATTFGPPLGLGCGVVMLSASLRWQP